jgi:hypothetical protein
MAEPIDFKGRWMLRRRSQGAEGFIEWLYWRDAEAVKEAEANGTLPEVVIEEWDGTPFVPGWFIHYDGKLLVEDLGPLDLPL